MIALIVSTLVLASPAQGYDYSGRNYVEGMFSSYESCVAQMNSEAFKLQHNNSFRVTKLAEGRVTLKAPHNVVTTITCSYVR